MASPFDDTPEELVELQTSVKDWVKKARKAVLTFSDEDGKFWRDSEQFRDSKQDTDLNQDQDNGKEIGLTTTARSYMALVYADRCLGQLPDSDAGKEWKTKFELVKGQSFSSTIANVATDVLRRLAKNNATEKQSTGDGPSIFEIAHFGDFDFVSIYLKYYTEKRKPIWQFLKNVIDKLISEKKARTLHGILEESNKSQNHRMPETIREGECYFDSDRPRSRHFFVTLHLLRALSILGKSSEIDAETIEKVVGHAQDFCIRQCFYAQQETRHKLDAARLAFACVIYSLYAKEVDQDVSIAAIKALAAMQQEDGRWPAAFPIIRPKQPWFIASDEIALCLTWLYFEPRVPDEARPHLLQMMEMYFSKWVKRTSLERQVEGDYGQEKRLFQGWQDDHSIGHRVVVGWVTSVVCHFLANYHSVLADHINRRVIETLGLQGTSRRYLIDRTQHEFSRRWAKSEKKDKAKNDEGNEIRLPTWYDLPPFAWKNDPKPKDLDCNEKLSHSIRWAWSDPSDEACISENLATGILCKILADPAARPSRECCAGILSGRPGTRKTTLVEALADILEWPLVVVPASAIFEEGFDRMEARATVVFRRLNYLTRCVIFFDEFEEFFLKRAEGKGSTDRAEEKGETEGTEEKDNIDSNVTPTHDRTIAAFTTSAMLPRLQDLHDERRNLIFLATNHLEKIDSAIKRPGRFDFQITIDHPTLELFTCDAESSYLFSPPKKTLEIMNVECESLPENYFTEKGENERSEEGKLNNVAKAVSEALADSDFQCDLKKLNYELSDADAGSPPLEDDEIKFVYVEAALKKVAEEFDSEGEPDALVKAATEELGKQIERARNSIQGPPDWSKKL